MKTRTQPRRRAPAIIAILMILIAPQWATAVHAAEAPPVPPPMDEAVARDWLARWEKNITASAAKRYCDREMGEELGWLISPFLSGFHYGYLTTGDTKWVDRLIDWADSLIRRGVKEPDGYIGWPKEGATGTSASSSLVTDSQLGEAMALEPIVLAADQIRKSPSLREKYGAKADEYIKLAEQTFQKWDSRGAWRKTPAGGLWVVPPFGIDQATGRWTAGYEARTTDGFSLPANKQNLVACWLIAMHQATGKPIYRDRAEMWFRVMKSLTRTHQDGRYLVWNYWDPLGPWDYKPDGSTKHWVGTHPNGGYYAVDVDGIVTAYQHGIVFTREDMDRLIATNRDFMWNRQVQGARFQRIDGEKPDSRWARSPGVLWWPLTEYDETLRKVFEANHDPAGWGGLGGTPRHLARFAPGLRSVP